MAQFESSIVTSIQSGLLREAARRGHKIKVEKRHGSEFSIVGMPDLFGCVDGKHFEIEVKRPGQRPEPIQYQRLREWAAAGAICGWATSVKEAQAILWPETTVPACTQDKPKKKRKSASNNSKSQT